MVILKIILIVVIVKVAEEGKKEKEEIEEVEGVNIFFPVKLLLNIINNINLQIVNIEINK